MLNARAVMDVGKLGKIEMLERSYLWRTRIIVVLGIILLIGVLVAQTIRPPALDPSDVPFPYDPNLCLSEPLEWGQARPGNIYVGDLHATDDDGDDVFFTLLSGPPGVTIQTGISVPDANDLNWPDAMVHYMTWSWQVPEAIGVYYFNFQAIDEMGGTDERTIIINVRTNVPPVLDVGGPKSVWDFWPRPGQRWLQQKKKENSNFNISGPLVVNIQKRRDRSSLP